MKKVIVINEENHGLLGVAETRDAAIRWLVSHNWINTDTEIWIPDTKPGKRNHYNNGEWEPLSQIVPTLDKMDFLRALQCFTDEQFENMGFTFAEEEIIRGTIL